MALKKQYEIDCRECDGQGDLVLGHPADPEARVYRCDNCGGSGSETISPALKNYGLEDVLSLGANMTYEEAIAIAQEDGLDADEADHLARHYGLTPTPVLRRAAI
jgi:excinuclease UvrABC ATPase subunit